MEQGRKREIAELLREQLRSGEKGALETARNEIWESWESWGNGQTHAQSHLCPSQTSRCSQHAYQGANSALQGRLVQSRP